jgi:glycine/D-amino acid oxidase-like deaminating enzyme
MPCYLPTAFAYFRQRPDGRVVVGGMRTRDERGEVGTADTLHPGIQDALGELVERHMPWARGARIDHRWSGTLGYSTDGLPVVGPVAGMSRVFVLGGYGGHGMGWAFKCAQLLTRRMRDGEPVPHLDTSRFASS